MPRARKLIPVSEDLVEEFTKISRKSGVPVAELIEIVLRQALRILRTRDDVESFLAEAIIRADMHRLGGFVVPLNALEELIDRVDDQTFNSLLSKVSSFASALASSARVRGLSDLLSVRGMLGLWIPSAQVDMESSSGSSKLIIILPPHSTSRRLGMLVECLAKSLLMGLGMEVTSSFRDQFVVTLEFRPKEGG